VRPFLYGRCYHRPLATNPDDWQEDAIRRPYSILLPVGFAVPPLLPEARCALTAPFRPYPAEARRYDFCGTVPWVAPAGSYPAPFLAGARTFLPYPVTQAAAVARPSGYAQLAVPTLVSKSNRKSIARHSPSMTPSRLFGRNLRWKATTAARPSAMP
jgi:hypothetical protein